MNISYACPRCDAAVRVDVSTDAAMLTCPRCGARHAMPSGAMEDGRVRRCVVCPSTELFIRKDFSQRLGLTIIVLGFAASCVTWYFYLWLWTFAILVGTALLDVVLYMVVPNVLQCYRCQALYREVKGLDEHGAFSLETYERHRQQAARLAEADARAQT